MRYTQSGEKGLCIIIRVMSSEQQWADITAKVQREEAGHQIKIKFVCEIRVGINVGWTAKWLSWSTLTLSLLLYRYQYNLRLRVRGRTPQGTVKAATR